MKNRFSFRKSGVFWGVTLILSAVLIILDSIGIGLGFLSGVPVISIVLGIICLAWLIDELIKLKISHIFFPLAFIFILFQDKIAQLASLKSPIMSSWIVLICALLLTIGTSMIFRTNRVSKKKDMVKNQHKFGSATQYFDAGEQSEFNVENNFGKTEVFFSNVENYLGDGTLRVENNMGTTVINVPKEWNPLVDIENNLGFVKTGDHHPENGKVLNIVGENNMGSVVIEIV